MTLRLKDPVSALTHGVAMLLAIVGAVPLLLKAAREPGVIHVFALAVFIVTKIMLYFSRAVYHSVHST